MRLLLTRPERDSQALAAELAALGHEAVTEPLLEVHFNELHIDPGHTRAVLATSANGVRALARHATLPALTGLPLFAVGPASAREAQDTGFAQVHVAGGDVTALADKVAETLQPGDKPLLHVSGAAAAGDLKGDLERRGYRVERHVGYEARAREAFSDGVMADLRAQRIDGVLIYSPRTAAIFTRLIRAAGLERPAQGLTYFCLSQAVAGKLQALGGVRTRIAAAPNQPALLKLIGKGG